MEMKWKKSEEDKHIIIVINYHVLSVDRNENDNDIDIEINISSETVNRLRNTKKTVWKAILCQIN